MLIVDVPLQTSVCLVRLSTCFAREHLPVSIDTLYRLLHSPLIHREVLVSLVSLKASLCLVSGSTSVTNIWFFNHSFNAFTILEHSEMCAESIICVETLVAFDAGKRSGSRMHFLVPGKGTKFWEPLVTYVTHVVFVLILRWHMVFVFILSHARVTPEKMLVAGLNFGLGAEGTSKLALWIILNCFVVFVWNIEKEALAKKCILGSEYWTPKIRIYLNTSLLWVQVVFN